MNCVRCVNPSNVLATKNDNLDQRFKYMPYTGVFPLTPLDMLISNIRAYLYISHQITRNYHNSFCFQFIVNMANSICSAKFFTVWGNWPRRRMSWNRYNVKHYVHIIFFRNSTNFRLCVFERYNNYLWKTNYGNVKILVKS